MIDKWKTDKLVIASTLVSRGYSVDTWEIEKKNKIIFTLTKDIKDTDSNAMDIIKEYLEGKAHEAKLFETYEKIKGITIEVLRNT